MQPINTANGHSPRRERKIAGILYIAIAIAVVAGLIFFVVLGKNRSSLSPYKTDQLNTVAPDTVPGTTGTPGTIATPNGMAPPETQPITN